MAMLVFIELLNILFWIVLDACAGLTAVSSCYSGGTCGQNMVCTSSNYCCECQYGQTGGLCTQVN